jgi:hypothetical protein
MVAARLFCLRWNRTNTLLAQPDACAGRAGRDAANAQQLQ